MKQWPNLTIFLRPVVLVQGQAIPALRNDVDPGAGAAQGTVDLLTTTGTTGKEMVSHKIYCSELQPNSTPLTQTETPLYLEQL